VNAPFNHNPQAAEKARLLAAAQRKQISIQ